MKIVEKEKYSLISDGVLEKLSSDTKKLFDIYDSMGLFKTTKQKSEDISALIENSIASEVEGAVAPKIDAEPDIRLNGKPVEIKTTNSESWFSGTFSKREGYFIFIRWLLNDKNEPEFFIGGKHLNKDEWTPSKSKSFYATTYDKKKLYANLDKWDIFKGNIEGYMRGKQQCIKINTEAV